MAENMEGAILKIIPHSALYKGVYFTRVLSQRENSLVVAMPEEKGKFIPLPVGTVLEVSYLHGNKAPFQSEIVARGFQGGRTLTITAPGSISRGGRAGNTSGTARVIAITSGKGGSGKSTVAINLSLALQSLGKKVCIVDVDLGTANVDFLLKLNPPYNLAHLINGQKDIGEILVRGPQGLLVVPGGSGLDELANLKEWQFSRLISAFNRLESFVDFLILDTGSGVSHSVTNFLLASDEIILVATPDPHAIMDVYSLIKVLANYKVQSGIKLIVNKAEKKEETEQIWNTISAASRQFLNIPVEYLGEVPFSGAIALSIKKQMPFFLNNRKHVAAESFLKISRLLTDTPPEKTKQTPSFIYKLKRIMQAMSQRDVMRNENG